MAAIGQVLSRLPESDGDKVDSIMQAQPNTAQSEGGQSFAVTLGGNRYILGTSVVIDRNADYHKTRFFCTFQLFDNNWTSIARTTTHIEDHADTNVCQMVFGLTGVTWPAASGSIDATRQGFIAIIQYHNGQNPAKTIAEIGNNWKRMAVLFAFEKNAQGQWTIVQDEHCLDPMNRIETLAAAKKAFAACRISDR
jgi:hypothetical protein